MNNIPKSPLPLLLGLAIALSFPAAHAADWSFNADASITQGTYKKSLQRDKLSERGLRITGDYLDRGGITLGYGTTWVGMKNGVTATDQNNVLLSGRMNFTPDAIPGRLTARLDAHRINNNDATRNTDDVSVLAAQLGWLAKSENLYADIGYADSSYQNQLSVRQYTPTVGFGLNGGSDWIQLRSYLVRGLNPARASGKSSTTGLDTKWTHYFAAQSAWVPKSLTLGVASGERIYGVDMDAQLVANLADLNKGAATLGLGWDINRNFKIFALAGQSRYRNVALANDYKLNVGYLGLNLNW